MELQTFSTKEFKYDAGSRTFSAELSDFGCIGIDSRAARFFGTIQDKRAGRNKYGFYLESAKTGNRTLMVLQRTVYEKGPIKEDDDRPDIVGWEFYSVETKTKTMIYND